MGAGRVAAALLALGMLAAFPGAAAARSPFAWRGVIEGPYGRPWDVGQRQGMLAFMAGRGFNAYVHAPKEDLYQRAQWRDPYPAAQQAAFDREIAFAKRHGIRWVPNLSPGAPAIPPRAELTGRLSAPLCYSCPADLGVVLGRFERFRRAGARTFMVSFDDVRKQFARAEDLEAYGPGEEAYGRANGDFLTGLLRALRKRDARARLLTVGADYLGTHDTPYLRGLRARLDPAVEVMWTGPGLFSQSFTARDAKAYGRAIGRVPLVWDNWTVNDYEGNAGGADRTQRIHLGPYRRGREAVGAVRGFFLNPMNEATLNTLPFLTAADYFTAPASYRPRASFLRAAKQLGGSAAAGLRAFAEVNYSDPFERGDDAPTFSARARALQRSYSRGGRWPARAKALERELELVRRAELQLGARPALHRFVAEGRPFLRAAARAARTGEAAVALLAGERPSLTARRAHRGFTGRAVAPAVGDAAASRAELAGRRRAMGADFRETYGERMETFVAAVLELDAGWKATAGRAARRVSLTLDGRPVEVAGDGRFALPRSAAGKLLVALDGAGGRTTVRVGRWSTPA